ncbi:MAG: hypothetical protein IKS19_02260 [Clostridia bacterium]|nr:hypothetical protein [Clostridia bacterium]
MTKQNQRFIKKVFFFAIIVSTALFFFGCAKKGIEGLPPASFEAEHEFISANNSELTPVYINYRYEQLTEKQKEIYVNIYNAVEEMYTGDLLLAKGAVKEDITAAVSAYYADNPQHFWVAESMENCWTATNNIGITLKKIGNAFSGIFGSTGNADFTDYTDAYGRFTYTFDSAEKRDEARNILKSVITEVISGINPSDDIVQREIYLHDWLCDNCKYDDEAFEEFVKTGSVGSHKNCHTAYGAIVEKTATCAGYARAMQLLLSEAGIENRFITGTRNDSSVGAAVAHAWNIVFIDGVPYHLDATGDDKDEWGVADGAYVEVKDDGKTYYNTGNRTEHRYFNITDEQISLDHYNFVPQLAISGQENYFTVKQLNFEDTTASIKQGLTSELINLHKTGKYYIELYAGANLQDQQQYLKVLVNGEDGMMYQCLKEANAMLGERYFRDDLVYYGMDEQSGIISIYTVPMETVAQKTE